MGAFLQSIHLVKTLPELSVSVVAIALHAPSGDRWSGVLEKVPGTPTLDTNLPVGKIGTK